MVREDNFQIVASLKDTCHEIMNIYFLCNSYKYEFKKNIYKTFIYKQKMYIHKLNIENMEEIKQSFTYLKFTYTY